MFVVGIELGLGLFVAWLIARWVMSWNLWNPASQAVALDRLAKRLGPARTKAPKRKKRRVDPRVAEAEAILNAAAPPLVPTITAKAPPERGALPEDQCRGHHVRPSESYCEHCGMAAWRISPR